MRWKAKVDGLWYEVVDVEDQGAGKQNIYHLKTKGPVEQEDIEDLDVAASVSFMPRLERLVEIHAIKKDIRKKLLKKQKQQIKKSVERKEKFGKKQAPSSDEKQEPSNNLGLNKYGNKSDSKLPAVRNEDKKVVEPEILDENNNPIQEQNTEPEVDDNDSDRPAGVNVSLDKIRSMEKPTLFVISFRNNKDSEDKFVVQTRSLLQTRHAMLFYRGSKNELKGTYALFISAPKQSELSNFVNQLNAPYVVSDLPEDFFSQDSPFDSLTFPELNSTLAGDETKLKRELNETMSRLNEEENSSGQISAVRLSSEIPIDYARFLTDSHRTCEYYIGGHPSNAGAPGSQFVLATQEEQKHFLRTMNGFKPPNPFFNDLYYVSDIDPDFKDYNPHKISPARALLLQAKTSFNMDEKITITSQGNEELMKENSKKLGQSEAPKEATQLQMLEAFVRVHMKPAPGTKPGKFAKRKFYIGNDWVHINRDSKVAILWGSRTSALSIDKKDILAALPFVKDAVLTFLK